MRLRHGAERRVWSKHVAAAVVLMLAASLLTACRTNVGVAAKVGGERISENRVNSFVTPTGANSSAAADAASRGSSLIPPKTLVVEFLLRETIFDRALRMTKGGLPSVGTLTALRDKGLTAVFQIPAGSTSSVERDLGNQLVGVGVSRSLITHVLRWVEMVYYLGAVRLKAASLSDSFAKALKIVGPVTVSPRYGVWSAKDLSVTTDDGNGAPSYLTVRPTASPAP